MIIKLFCGISLFFIVNLCAREFTKEELEEVRDVFRWFHAGFVSGGYAGDDEHIKAFIKQSEQDFIADNQSRQDAAIIFERVKQTKEYKQFMQDHYNDKSRVAFAYKVKALCAEYSRDNSSTPSMNTESNVYILAFLHFKKEQVKK